MGVQLTGGFSQLGRLLLREVVPLLFFRADFGQLGTVGLFGGQCLLGIIIAQADNLRMVLGKLGVLRMRKLELKDLKTAAEVDKRTVEILAEIQSIADKLQVVGK